MDREELRRKIQNYNSDEDIEKSGGKYGMILADLMYSYDLMNEEGNSRDDSNFPISQKEFKNLAYQMGIMNASRIGAIDSKKRLLTLAGIFDIIASDGKVIKLDEATPREIDHNFRDYYNQR